MITDLRPVERVLVAITAVSAVSLALSGLRAPAALDAVIVVGVTAAIGWWLGRRPGLVSAAVGTLLYFLLLTQPQYRPRTDDPVEVALTVAVGVASVLVVLTAGAVRRRLRRRHEASSSRTKR